ncbi:MULTISPECIES: HAMP domain-containing sensor histidine kinase [unclassified Clostridium]|uniref:sensor histidine kinase n=1 Tax=unclassified Clostridium TaxID=2614128 RepID=UPI0002976B51|nr:MULTISPECIES: HAMP domain-containing sensor histidine kinase [unclassified Clostridium]EKQ53529.1 MAG: signal transduction histidine kinase [Clostridium sp. Maddingley MBC34-26]
MNFRILNNARISIKLTIIYAFMFSLILFLINAAVLFGIEHYLYREADRDIEDTKGIILNMFISPNVQLNLADKEVFSNLAATDDIYIRIVKENGELIKASDDFPFDISKLNSSIKYTGDKEKHLEDKGRHLEYKSIEYNSQEYGLIYFQIVKDMESEYNFMKIAFVLMAAADSIGIIASIAVGYIVSKKMLKPIDYITKTADNISINNLKERIDITGADDELKRLADTFNKMIDRLQSSFNRQAQFVSDASHELRTPIAVVKGYANLLDRWGKNDKDALEKSIYAIKLEADNMANLVEKLLFLAKGDNGTQVIEKTEFYINNLVDEVIVESNVIDDKHDISSQRNDSGKIIADYEMIKQMLRIFISNSIKFTPEGGKIEINSEIYKEFIKIIVSDTGIGIPKDEIDNIFERFYIVDKSRSKEKAGSGLGLSIAKWIVDIHQGTIDVESEEGKGTSIIVKLYFNKHSN